MPGGLEAPGPARDEPVDVHRLVRRVRLQRLLRGVSRLAVVALIGWFFVLGIGQGSTHEGTATYQWFDDHGNRGFAVILVVLGVDLVLWVASRLFRTGRAAARFVPLIRRVPEAVEVDARAGSTKRVPIAAAKGRRLIELGNRRVRIPPADRSRTATVVIVGLLLGSVWLAAYTGTEVGPKYRASHGHNGPVVTIGKDSHISRRVTNSSDDGPQYDYYITSPIGEALAEGDGKPQDGTRFSVTRLNGSLRAVHVGGHSWVTDLVLAIVGALGAALTLGSLVYRIATWKRDPRRVPLADTVARLSAGTPTAVRAGEGKYAVRLTAARLGARDPGDVVQSQRWTSAALAVGALLVLTLAGVVTAFA